MNYNHFRFTSHPSDRTRHGWQLDEPTWLIRAKVRLELLYLESVSY